MENRESLDGPLCPHSRREGAGRSGAVASDTGAHCPTVRTTAQASDKILSVIDSSPSKVSVRTHPRPQPAQHPRDGPQHTGRPQFAPRVRCLHLRGDPVQDDLSSHNIPKTLTEAFATKTVGAGRPRRRSVRSRGRDQDNPLLVRRQRPGTTRPPTRVTKLPSSTKVMELGGPPPRSVIPRAERLPLGLVRPAPESPRVRRQSPAWKRGSVSDKRCTADKWRAGPIRGAEPPGGPMDRVCCEGDLWRTWDLPAAIGPAIALGGACPETASRYVKVRYVKVRYTSRPGRIRTFAHGLGNRCSIP